MDKKVKDIPAFGWKVQLDYVFPQKRSQFRWYSLCQIYHMIALFFRYIVEYVWKWFHGETLVMDYLNTANCDQQSGVPIGGIGGGTIGRGFKGEFSRYQMVPGVYEYPSTTVDAAQFIVNIQDASKKMVYQRVLSCQKPPGRGKLSSWKWNFPGSDAEYTALYPRSWTVFNIKEHKIKLICRQISPVIPNNYKDSSIPGAVFDWTVYNFSNEKKYVSITFTFKSGSGVKKFKSDKIQTEVFEKNSAQSNIFGVLIKQELQQMPLTYGLAALKKDSVEVTSMFFDPNSNGKTLWDKLTKDGELNSGKTAKSAETKETASALCSRCPVNSSDSSTFVFALTWDNPLVKFPKAQKPQKRYYTKYFGDSGTAAPDICLYCIENYSKWELSIHKWQETILENDGLPAWYKSALFNELYYVSDGGTIWLLVEENLPDEDPRKEYGRFGYLEGHEYRMVNTYDVHFYASFALVMLWPQLQLSMQYDFRDSIVAEDKTIFWFLYNGEKGFRKVKNTVPHDLGDPEEDPFNRINIYDIHDVSQWKDLNLKFVLQVYRDFIITSDIKYLKDMFPQALIVMQRALTWGTEKDGMIKNSGFPDQTYDAWTMSGISAYCGSLWLASLAVFIKMAKLVNATSVANDFSEVFEKAKVTFEQKLWNGQYFKFDSSGGSHSNSIMADQLCGLWYLHSCNISDEVFAKEKVKKALEFIYKMNVCNYYDGQQGAVNGMLPDGRIDKSAVQSEEVWTGVTYALASLLIFEGYVEEGLSTAKGLYETVYEKSGLGFATPEGLVDLKSFRAISYMRPLSIWSMQLALEKSQKNFV